MLICEYEFEAESPSNKGYSEKDFDFYEHIPYKLIKKGTQQHRLSLRKNLKTGKYEIYRCYWYSKYIEIIYTYSTLSRAVETGNSIHNHIWTNPLEKQWDEICDHTDKRCFKKTMEEKHKNEQ